MTDPTTPAPDDDYPPPPPSYPPPPSPPPPPAAPPPPTGAQPGFAAPPPPAGYTSADDKNWALIAHFGGAVGAFVSLGVLGFVGPLVAYLAKGQQSPTVRTHSLAALNFQILWSIIAFVLTFISWCLLFIPSLVVMAIQVVFGILAGVQANEGRLYKYPMSGSFVK